MLTMNLSAGGENGGPCPIPTFFLRQCLWVKDQGSLIEQSLTLIEHSWLDAVQSYMYSCNNTV